MSNAPRPERVMGIDPGFANTGMAVLENGPDGIFARQLRMVRAQKAAKKAVVDVRVSVDDSRRLRIVFDALTELCNTWQPQALAVEAYQPFTGRGGGNAWKCAMTYGLVQGFAFSRKLALYCFLPSDLKRNFGAKLSASKGDVAATLCDRVLSLAHLVAEVPRGQREHVTDATGHAYLAFAQMMTMRHMAGLEVGNGT